MNHLIPVLPSLLALWLLHVACTSVPSQTTAQSSPPTVELLREGEQVKILMNGTHFSTYLQPEGIKKPILYPILTATGTAVTRGYPIDPRPGERADHPHHIGVWLNHGDVNDLDFWNHSTNVKPERKDRYGTIVHRGIEELISGETGLLRAAADWLSPDGDLLLRETSTYFFTTLGGVRSLERQTTLVAVDDSVHFEDNKEGMFGIRLARQLEQPILKPAILLGEDGLPMAEKVNDTTGVSGQYRNAARQEGDEVWGTRGPWVCIDGRINGESVSVAIFDHPSNPGHPASWHARGYGLFSVNNLGRKAYNKQEERFDVSLGPGEKLVFRHRLSVYAKKPAEEDLDAEYEGFSQR